MGSPDPDGAAQEALTRSLRHPHSADAIRVYFDGAPEEDDPMPAWTPARIQTFLAVVLRNVVLEQLRKESRSRGGGEESTPERPDPDPGPLEALLHKERTAALAACMTKLRDCERRALLLLGDGFPYADIAKAMGASESNVNSWIHRGKDKLKRCLRRWLTEPKGGR